MIQKMEVVQEETIYVFWSHQKINKKFSISIKDSKFEEYFGSLLIETKTWSSQLEFEKELLLKSNETV